MNRERIRLFELLLGLALVITGLFLFTKTVNVTSSILSGRLIIGSINVSSYLVCIPLVVGLVMTVIKPKWIASKIVAGVGFILIAAMVIVTTTIRLPRISIGKWFLFIGLIVVGLLLLCHAMLFNNRKDIDK